MQRLLTRKDCANYMIFVSVVRDFPLYIRSVRENRNNVGARFVVYDNNVENKRVPTRYNEFLDSYDFSLEDWIVFCHEDFQFLEPLSEKLSLMNKGSIYGVFGALPREIGVGLQIDSNKDGSDASFRGFPVIKATLVDTVDCACLIVHSSLVLRYGLRFDENLTFDLYVEDFVISAHQRFGVKTYVLPIKSQHYSYGNITSRFYEQLDYLNRKYSDLPRVYVTTTAEVIGRSDKLEKMRVLLRRRKLFRRFFRKKVSHKGDLLIKVLGVLVWKSHKFNINQWGIR